MLFSVWGELGGGRGAGWPTGQGRGSAGELLPAAPSPRPGVQGGPPAPGCSRAALKGAVGSGGGCRPGAGWGLTPAGSKARGRTCQGPLLAGLADGRPRREVAGGRGRRGQSEARQAAHLGLSQGPPPAWFRVGPGQPQPPPGSRQRTPRTAPWSPGTSSDRHRPGAQRSGPPGCVPLKTAARRAREGAESPRHPSPTHNSHPQKRHWGLTTGSPEVLVFRGPDTPLPRHTLQPQVSPLGTPPRPPPGTPELAAAWEVSG